MDVDRGHGGRPFAIHLYPGRSAASVITHLAAPVEAAPWRVNAWELLRDAAVFFAGLLLAFSYLWPAAGQSWLSNLWIWPGSIPWVARSAYLSQYFSQHAPWAVLLAALASMWLIAAILGEPREATDGP